MTKVYLVRSVRLDISGTVSNHVENVFTNKKLAVIYAKWLKSNPLEEYQGKQIHVEIYIDTRKICRNNYSELPF